MKLKPIQVRILNLLKTGMRQYEIAEQLKVSTKSVNCQVKYMVETNKCKNLYQLIYEAAKRDVI